MAENKENSIISNTYVDTSSELVTVDQVREEASRAVARLADAYAKGTQRAYRASWRIFSRWCSARSIVLTAVTPEIACTYLEWRLGNGLGARAVVREYSALAVHLREIQPAGPWLPKSPPEILRRWLKGAAKRAVPAVQKQPLLPEHFAKLGESTREATVKDARDRAILLFGFAGGFRRSELVALDVIDVRFEAEGAIVHVRRSKTDQDAKGAYVAVWRQLGRRCPVEALERYLRWGGITEGAMFRTIRTGAVTSSRLPDRAVALIVKTAVSSLGLDPKKYAGHSLRCGFVTAAHKRGASIDEIMNTTRHRKADQVIGYIRRATPFEGNASKGILADEPRAETALAIASRVMCARGHEYDAQSIGLFCRRDECKEGQRGDPSRRIEHRVVER